MGRTKLCPDKTCRFLGCRRIAHHGANFRVACPQCGAAFVLAEIGNAPIPAVGPHPPREGQHHDWRHATGVTCASCNHYFIPPETHQDLRDTMEEWERPVRSRPAPDFAAMRARLRPRMAEWRGGGLRSQHV